MVPLAESKQQPQPSAYSNCRDHLIIHCLVFFQTKKKKMNNRLFLISECVFWRATSGSSYKSTHSVMSFNIVFNVGPFSRCSSAENGSSECVNMCKRPNHLNNLIAKGRDALETKRATTHVRWFCMRVKLFCGLCVAFPHSVQETVACRLQRLRH